MHQNQIGPHRFNRFYESHTSNQHFLQTTVYRLSMEHVLLHSHTELEARLVPQEVGWSSKLHFIPPCSCLLVIFLTAIAEGGP